MVEQRKSNRFFIYLIFVTLLVIVILGRYFYLMVIVPAKDKFESIQLPVVERGPILDRNGRILAISTKLDSVSAWMPDVTEFSKTASDLAEILDLDAGELLENLESRSGFLYVKRKVTPTESQRIEQYKSEGKLKGINLVPEFGRNYPEQELASHVIGYVGVDNIGLSGIEYTFNQVLSPPIVGKELSNIHGNQVFLTIDVTIQYALEKAAQKAYEAHLADSVMILVMEAQTGDILGYCSAPNFDPNEFMAYDAASLLNRPATFAYEPGSVFKIFSISSFLESGGITLEDTFYCNGYYEQHLVDGDITRIACLGTHGDVYAREILRVSCNAGAAYASEQVDAQAFHQKLLDFGFGNATQLFAGETSGILRKPAQWSTRTKATLAFGQEISVSTLQIITAATVFANDGAVLQPHIVKKIVSPEGKIVKEFHREPVRQVLSPETARQVVEMMEAAVSEEGTARRARIDGIRVSAKTGTAQVYDPRTDNYSEDHFISSFLGIFPTNQPQFIIYVVIDHPRGEQFFGGVIASPVFKEIAEDLITYSGTPYESDSIVVHSGKVSITMHENIQIGNTMPDLTGLPKRSLLPLFSRDDLEIFIRGEGYVVRQSPETGEQVTENTKIILELE